MNNKLSLTRERCWKNYGGLSGCVTRLDMIAKSETTLPEEASDIAYATSILKLTLLSWKSNYSRVKEKINELK